MRAKFYLFLLVSFCVLFFLWLGFGSSYSLCKNVDNKAISSRGKSHPIEENRAINEKQQPVSHTGDNVEKKQAKKSICLNMIVKNENHVIERCLATVKPIIDYWVIVDTGSTDGTQETIKEFMKNIPGELHERPWVNFAHNRNLALDLAKEKADYALIIDADEMLEYAPGFIMPPLDQDAYAITLIRGNNEYSLTSLCKLAQNWKWHGVLHEYLASPIAKTMGHIQGVIRTTKSDGARSQDPEKYKKDAQVLQAALLEEPNNDRYMFYLAQSHRDAREYEKSIEAYKKRVAMKGWDQEVFYSLWQIARLQEILNMEPSTVVSGYYAAFAYRPSRAEPLNDLAKYYRSREEFEKAYKVAAIGKKIAQPKDILFVEKTAYDFDLELEYSISAYWIGKYQESLEASEQLLSKKNLPDYVRPTVEANLGFAKAKLQEQKQE